MKKKLLAVVLCIAMLFTFSASGALAEEIGTNGTQENVGVIDEQNDAAGQDESDQTDLTEGSLPDGSDPSSSSGEESAEIEEGTAAGGDSEEGQTPENGENSSDPASEQNPSAEAGDASDVSDPQDYASMTAEELYAYIMQLGTDEEKEAVLAALPQEKIDALVAYAQEQEAANYVPPETVVFTDAGPFMPPVSVVVEQKITAAMKKLFNSIDTGATYALDNAITTFETAGNGLKLSKVATANADGSYTIRMEAYTTGTVTTSTKTVPVDIVLVLDQSGSMAYDFNGKSTDKDADRRQYAMKQAVNNFISAVANKYTEKADHRMAIVTFGDNASTLQDWTPVDEAGETTLQGEISRLPKTPRGATNVAEGMSKAELLMGNDGYNYSGENTQRQKVVIVFTDGVPTTSTEFNTTVATNAIAKAKNLKDGGATVYTVGIFNGANPDELHGEKWVYTVYSDITCTGEVGSFWGGSWLSSIVGSNDFEGIDIAAGNRFLNYLSSNSKDATEIGLKRGSFNPSGKIGGYGTGYEITANYSKTNSEYYLTANTSNSLNNIFQTISENIQTANIDLGSETVIKDTVSQYFNLPANDGDIKLYTAAAKKDGTFEADVPASGVTAKIENNAVSVTGFDFNANFVSDKPKEDNTYGKKLIIEFDVTPKGEFIGGNDVPTNDWKNTAVYDKNGTEVEKFADASTTPTVNVPIKSPEFSVNDKTIYEGKSTAVSGLYTLPDTTGWQFDYVTVTVSGVDTETGPLTDCTDYTINVNYAPKTAGIGSEGTANDMTGKSTEKTATVHVLKHDVTATVNDVQKYYGESYTLGNGVTPVIKVEWIDTNSHTGIPAVEGTAPYTARDLELSYAADGYKGTVPKDDFDVEVKVMKGEKEISNTTIITNCTFGCTDNQQDGKYTVHVKTCQLTVAKAGGAEGEPYVFTVKKDGEKYSEITVVGNTSEKIYELPVGTYTIEEDTGWSWRYSPGYNRSSVTLDSGNTSGTINCTNTSKSSKWLNGFSSVVQNIYGIVKQ